MSYRDTCYSLQLVVTQDYFVVYYSPYDKVNYKLIYCLGNDGEQLLQQQIQNQQRISEQIRQQRPEQPPQQQQQQEQYAAYVAANFPNFPIVGAAEAVAAAASLSGVTNNNINTTANNGGIENMEAYPQLHHSK